MSEDAAKALQAMPESTRLVYLLVAFMKRSRAHPLQDEWDMIAWLKHEAKQAGVSDRALKVLLDMTDNTDDEVRAAGG